MNDGQDFAFGRFVPGFDFLQSLAKGASEAMPQMPGLSNWIAPTLSVEELDKRISELRAVQFWLEQNGKALAATIQALEVQKMTLSTLKHMDVTMADLAEALKAQPQAAAEPEPAKPATGGVGKPPGVGREPASPGDGAPKSGGPAPVDPMQWWGALTQQFQQIAASAMQQAAQQPPAQTAGAATATAEPADVPKSAAGARPTAAAKKARKSAPRKSATRKSAASGAGGGS
ncbi:hypothetical protein JI739_12385 [Ramlibacter sp. AW1]|uniref:Uncharacterized protein n=1 Tax=Ramlibacter aurantiacus TaxID=2801330 RepID=A0A937D5B1_9BURK|nr:PhaM family polyhydroxyalkanoate granule multifunctional regulatory protein [Ramlibacter aurantiacus]MBL0421147.1 hypothetical protein [Ramlibacter aurantiacus]